jgi:hypothetical protein
MNIDYLVDSFNAEFTFSKEAVKRLLEKYETVDFSETETLYAVSNRKEQICTMFSLGRDRNFNKELMGRTKGYAVDAVVAYAIPLRAALNASKSVVENSAKVAELEALVAQLQAENTELRVRVNAIVKAFESLQSGVRQVSLGVVTKAVQKVLSK